MATPVWTPSTWSVVCARARPSQAGCWSRAGEPRGRRMALALNSAILNGAYACSERASGSGLPFRPPGSCLPERQCRGQVVDDATAEEQAQGGGREPAPDPAPRRPADGLPTWWSCPLPV